MAPKPVWKGYLKLSLVTCAVELSGATTQSEKVSFRTLNRKTGNAVRRQYVDQVSGKPVADKDEVRGFAIGKDDYLLIEDQDIENVQIESSHTLNLESFVAKADVDPVYIERPYYLTPGDKVSEEAFAVIRKALENRKMAGLARIVLYQRERPCMIEPFGKGMLLTTLRYGSTVRSADEAYEGGKVTVDPDLLEMAMRVVERKKGEFDPSTFEDEYEKAVMDLIKSRKKRGNKTPVRKTDEDEQPSNVINLFDALKKSLASDRTEKGEAQKDGKPTGKKSAPKSAPKSDSKSSSSNKNAGRKAGKKKS